MIAASLIPPQLFIRPMPSSPFVPAPRRSAPCAARGPRAGHTYVFLSSAFQCLALAQSSNAQLLDLSESPCQARNGAVGNPAGGVVLRESGKETASAACRGGGRRWAACAWAP